MAQIKIYCSWLDPGKPINEIDGSVDVELYVDDTPTTPIPPGTIRIIAILEPFDYLKNRMIQYLNDYKDFYNYVFTYHQDTYNSKLKSMEENYKITKEYYSSFENSMIRKIKELIKSIR